MPEGPGLRSAGAIFGRGTADTKSNIVAHVGALESYGGIYWDPAETVQVMFIRFG